MDLSNVKVLMIEDDEDDMLIIEDYIGDINEAKNHFSLTAYLNTEVAIEGIQEEQYHIVLLDLNLIESNGVETLKQFRAKVPHLPVIVLTGLVDEQTALDCIREGASDYLIKGKLNADQLKRTIQYSIERYYLLSEIKNKQIELQRSYNELEQLAYVSSHDLKDPLKNMIGFANIILKKYEGAVDESGKKMLRYLADESARHYQQIQALLYFLEAGKPNKRREEIDFEKTVLKIMGRYGTKLVSYNIEIKFDDLGTVFMYPEDVNSLLERLIENAIQFRKADELLEIEIETENLKEGIQIIIKDNGIGVPLALQEEVFNLFKKVNSTSKGIGMGLPICKKIAESYGGHIKLKSDGESGTSVIIFIPHPLFTS